MFENETKLIGVSLSVAHSSKTREGSVVMMLQCCHFFLSFSFLLYLESYTAELTGNEARKGAGMISNKKVPSWKSCNFMVSILNPAVTTVSASVLFLITAWIRGIVLPLNKDQNSTYVY